MKNLAIISCSVRRGRLSHRVAIFLKNYIENNHLARVDLIDLKQFDFPLFDERLMYNQFPDPPMTDYDKRFKAADAVIFVTPVYNGSFPASLKNIVDFLYKEWKHKVAGVISCTSTTTPGISTIQQVSTILAKLGAVVAPVICTMIDIQNAFDETGNATNPEQTEKFVRPLIEEALWLVENLHTEA